MRSIIFDLDLTLVDTTPLEQARADRNWQLAYSKISECHLYDGIQEILDVITKHHIPTAIVSTSPGKYVQNVTDYFHIPVDQIIGYHDAKPHKPAPAPMLLALQKLGCSADQAISFGDRVIDIQASNAANIESVACFWGTKEKKELILSGYRHAIIHPREILTLIR